MKEDCSVELVCLFSYFVTSGELGDLWNEMFVPCFKAIHEDWNISEVSCMMNKCWVASADLSLAQDLPL